MALCGDSTRYSYGNMKWLWLHYGGSPASADLAAAIAMAESSGYQYACNHNTDGSIDRGLWQINSVHGSLSTYDIVGNTKAAISISSDGVAWHWWTTYTSGAYLNYLSPNTPPQPIAILGGSGSAFYFPMPRSAASGESSWSTDQGVDIAAPAHTPLYAVGTGTIVLHGIGGFGPWAPVLHLDSGQYVYYGHAGPGNWTNDGARVNGGNVISEVGAGIVGISTGPHLEIGFCDHNGQPTPGTASQMLSNLQASYATGSSSGGGVSPDLSGVDFSALGFDMGQDMHAAFDAMGGAATYLYDSASYVIADMYRIRYCGEHGAF